MIDLIVDLLLAALMLLAIYGIGRSARRLVRLNFWSHAADLAFALAFGLGITATVLFVLALMGLLIPVVGWVILIIGCVLTVAQWRILQQDASAMLQVAHEVMRGSWFIRAATLIGLVFIVMNLMGDLAPPIEGDTVHQYLLTSREWVSAGRYVQPAHIWASTLPGNMMMISAWALLLNGSFSLPTLVNGLGFSLYFVLAVYALARLHLGVIPSILASVVVYTMPDVGYLAQSSKVDMGWAFFEVLALASVFHWMDAHDENPAGSNQWLLLGGVCLGLAAGSKNQTFLSIAQLGMWIVLRMALRRDWRGMLVSGATFGMGVIGAGFPYYLYNGIVHHNPLYPVFADQFVRWAGATASPRSELGTEIAYPWTVAGYLTNLWNMSLGHGPKFYLGFIIGPVLLLTLPIGMLLGYLRGQRTLWRMLTYAFIFSILWFLVKQAARHFLPGLTLLSVIAGYILWRLSESRIWSRRWLEVAALLCLIGNLVVWLGVLYWNQSYRVAFGLETRTQYLERLHDQVFGKGFMDWEAITYLNEHLTHDDRILTLHPANPLYVTPQLVSASWGDRIAYDGMDNAETLIQAMANHNIEYILIFKSDGAKLPLFAQPVFVAEYGQLVYDGPRVQLYHLVSGTGE
jgi:4-amino-4-deoxy-L-arabinose transferase-like glycosyltransferase